MNTSKPWYIVDATDKILGRLASTIAIYIRGKDLATFTPSCDMGAFVIVVSTNTQKVFVTQFFFLTYGLIVWGVFKGSLSRLSEILALVWLPWHKSILGGLRCLWLGYCISIFVWQTSYDNDDNGTIFIGNYVYILLFSTLGTVVLRSTNMPNCLTSMCPSHVGHMHDMILFGHMSNMPKYVSFFFFPLGHMNTLGSLDMLRTH